MTGGTGGGVRKIRAVLFDWRGTLAHCPPPEWWAARAAAAVDRDGDREAIQAAVNAIHEAGDLDGIDVSAAAHRMATMGVFQRHGLEHAMAEALYALDGDPANHPLYPDTVGVLRELKARGTSVAVVSDFHADVRGVLTAQGATELVDTWVLSFEHGVQKPDLRIFALALDALRVEPSAALMVGDRASHDGGAAAGGIPTLILPPPPSRLEPRGLRIVLGLVG